MEWLEQALKQQTDAVIVELEAYKRGYLNALSFVGMKIAEKKAQEQKDVSEATLNPAN